MKNFLFRTVGRPDPDYATSVEFALPAYENPLLRSLRQGFPSYFCMFRSERLRAVCGFRSAKGGLFLEQFLQESADIYVKRFVDAPVRRDEIVELGAFRADSAALAPLFAAQMEDMLSGEGFSHALALSPSDAGNVTEWIKERATIKSLKPDMKDPRKDATLRVCVLPLANRA